MSIRLAWGKGPKHQEDVSQIPQWKLSVRRFWQNKLSAAGFVVLAFFYLTAIFADFIAPYKFDEIDSDFPVTPPSRLRFDLGGVYIHPQVAILDKANFKYVIEEDLQRKVYINLFVQGYPYHLFGFIPVDRHLFGIEKAAGQEKADKVFLLGTDRQGRDMFSRVMLGGQVSLSIGVLSIVLSTLLGAVLGTASGYYGGWIDNLMQRVIELIQTFPTIPLWAALSAVLPRDMPVVQRYVFISVILSLINWTGLARQVRGKVMGYRNADYTAAAQAAGASDMRIILKHLAPNALSHIIVVSVMAIPGTIMGETALSFLGLGILPPAVSWGVLMRGAMSLQTILGFPWLLLPAGAVIVVVLCFNFLGDGLRDAVDPYS
jgi:peptide/nickel transport system permease protein